jgi:hypothetical protein
MRTIQRAELAYILEPIAQDVLRRRNLQAAHITAAATTPLRTAVHIPVL